MVKNLAWRMPSQPFSQSSEDLIRSERHRECKSGRVREFEAIALNIFEFILIKENVGRESAAPAELLQAANTRTMACGHLDGNS
jgi:hypothetical protein